VHSAEEGSTDAAEDELLMIQPKMKVLQHKAPRQLAHAYSAEQGSKDVAEDEHLRMRPKMNILQ
jgi:hypothetical protein